MQRTTNNILKAFAMYLICIIVCILTLVWVMKLWRMDLNIPLGYGGDSLFYSMCIKGVADNGWFLSNNYIGAPYGMNLYDFPMSDNLHFVIIKFLLFIVPNWVTTLNIYYLITFPLTALTTMIVLRQFKISYPIAILGSILYTFLPYHFMRGISHLFLAAYHRFLSKWICSIFSRHTISLLIHLTNL
jgi:hypothetical protein